MALAPLRTLVPLSSSLGCQMPLGCNPTLVGQLLLNGRMETPSVAPGTNVHIRYFVWAAHH